MKISKFILSLVALLLLPLAAFAQDAPGVSHIILLDGDEVVLAEAFAKRQALYKEINPDVSMRLMYDEVHGSVVGRYRLHIYFPNPAYFAAAQGRERSSDELKALRKTRSGNSTRVYEGLSRIVVTAGG